MEHDFPVIIRNKLTNWKVLRYTRSDWCEQFKGRKLIFREGNKTFTETPCWEHLCRTREMKLSEFFELSTEESKNWLYFDYKYMKDIFRDDKSLMSDINWADLGLLGFTGEDSAFWIGNEGAHTPCHMDTYGCNFVAQIFGRKLWVLIPPDETDCLKPVRVPYEESSIYSSYNFYTPNDSLLGIKKAYSVILHPGEVLYIPRHWWHYVENLEVAISVNVWVPLEEDHESRLGESLVQHYVARICEELSEEERRQILNPNELGLTSERCTLHVIEDCVGNYKRFKSEGEHRNEAIKEVMEQLKNDLTRVDSLDLSAYVSEKRSFREDNRGGGDVTSKVRLAKKLINSYCNPASIKLLTESILKEV